ncbi:hypothetical protein JB92DRAFT_3103544 [Gautieria morchelliformis]|nr:hypothetical protein JB92DRAFT_3103544 [Gautieria morchelliformis]
MSPTRPPTHLPPWFSIQYTDPFADNMPQGPATDHPPSPPPPGLDPGGIDTTALHTEQGYMPADPMVDNKDDADTGKGLSGPSHAPTVDAHADTPHIYAPPLQGAVLDMGPDNFLSLHCPECLANLALKSTGHMPDGAPAPGAQYPTHTNTENARIQATYARMPTPIAPVPTSPRIRRQHTPYPLPVPRPRPDAVPGLAWGSVWGPVSASQLERSYRIHRWRLRVRAGPPPPYVTFPRSPLPYRAGDEGTLEAPHTAAPTARNYDPMRSLMPISRLRMSAEAHLSAPGSAMDTSGYAQPQQRYDYNAGYTRPNAQYTPAPTAWLDATRLPMPTDAAMSEQPYTGTLPTHGWPPVPVPFANPTATNPSATVTNPSTTVCHRNPNADPPGGRNSSRPAPRAGPPAQGPPADLPSVPNTVQQPGTVPGVMLYGQYLSAVPGYGAGVGYRRIDTGEVWGSRRSGSAVASRRGGGAVAGGSGGGAHASGSGGGPVASGSGGGTGHPWGGWDDDSTTI